MKTLKFTSDLASKILSGEKTSTWRLFDDKDLKTGDDLDLINSQTGKIFAKSIINSVIQKKFEDLVEDDFKGHQKYSNEKEMYEDFQKYYSIPITPTTLLKIINFELR
ncbi:MAG: ASCH domain-containing protein [Nitrospira sp.]